MLVQLIHTANDSGHSGARMGLGPAALLAAGAADLLRQKGHQVEVVRVEPRDSFPAEIASGFRVATGLARQVRMAMRQRRFPVVLAGNCLASIGVIAGHPAGATGIVWLDAHADFHTPETTTSGFLDGMALAAAVGHCWRGMLDGIPGFRPASPTDILLVGARDVDPAEDARLREHGVGRWQVDRLRGENEEFRAAAASLGGRTERLHLHLDLDVLDPEAVGPANRFAPPGGLTAAEVEGVVASVQAGGRLASVTLSAYDPAVDIDASVRDTALHLLDRIVTG